MGQQRARHLHPTIRYILSLLKPDSCVHQFFKFAKQLTALAKQAGQFFHPNWRMFCYWETAAGFQPYKEQSELQAEVDDWLVNVNPNGYPGDEDAYLTKIYQETKQLLQQEWRRPEKIPTVDDWLARGSWMRGRGGTGVILDTHIKGRRTRTRRNKGTDAVIMSDATIRNELYTPYPQQLIVMQKSEPTKIRPVVKSDNQLFRKMDFLSEVIERGLYGSRLSPLFLGAVGNEKLDLYIFRHIKEGLNCPLDQGSFDNHQSKASILVVLQAIHDHCFKDLTIPAEYTRVWAAMANSLTHPETLVINGKFKKAWNNGVPSGWRWTALVDTILNIVTFRINVKLAQLKHGGGAVWDAVHQGDDIHFKTSSVSFTNKLVDTYLQTGYEVHPQKTYLSKSRTEFLRRSYEEGGITGYLPRILSAIRFRNPIKQDPISRPSRAFERVTIYMLTVLRGASPQDAATTLLEDGLQYGIDKTTMADFCLTPNAVGGVGMRGQPGGFCSQLVKYSTGDWVVSKTTKKTHDIQVEMGEWSKRMHAVGLTSPDLVASVTGQLIQTWGIVEAQITESMSTEWVRVEKIAPLAVEGGMDLPPAGQVWEDEKIPTMLRQAWKQQKIRDQSYLDFIKPEYRASVTTLQRRVSGKVFQAYLLGTYIVPSPMIDTLGAKYGADWKKRALALTLRALSAISTNMYKLTRKCLWIEQLGITYLSKLASQGIFAT